MTTAQINYSYVFIFSNADLYYLYNLPSLQYSEPTANKDNVHNILSVELMMKVKHEFIIYDM